MREARSYQRLGFHFTVGLSKRPEIRMQRCSSLDISLGGLFAEGANGLTPNQPVSLAIDLGQDELHLNGRVVRVCPNGVGCRFTDSDSSSVERLQKLLTPDWDGGNLLEAVLRTAPWHPRTDLVDWMRLTSFVSQLHRPKPHSPAIAPVK